MSKDLKEKNKKITEFTKKLSIIKSAKKDEDPKRISLKRPISPDNLMSLEKGLKQHKPDEMSRPKVNTITNLEEDPITSVANR